MSETLILGAGVSGLAAGWALRCKDVPARILEAGEMPGGKLRTLERDGFRFELGPHAVQSSPELFELLEAAGLREGVVPASDQLTKRYLVHRGALVAAPMSLGEAWSSPVISKKGLLRAFSEPFRRRGPGSHESVTRFVERRLGGEVARLAGTLVLGIFAGDADELAMAHAFPSIYRLEAEHGSLVRGALALRKEKKAAGGQDTGSVLCSFSGGLGGMVEGLASGLEIAYSHQVTDVVPVDSGFEVRGRSPDGAFELRTEQLISALPIDVAARVLSNLGATESFDCIPHAEVAVLNLGFRRAQVRHPLDGFGFLSPPYEDRMLLGCHFFSTLFADRAPEDHVSLTVMAGGRLRREDLELDDAKLLERVLYELERLMGIEGEPVASEITRWMPGIAQATARTADVKQAVESMERAHPGLKVLGDWLHGVGVPACVQAGWSV